MRISKKDVAVALIFLLGLAIIPISQYRTERETESVAEDGKEYSIDAAKDGPILQGATLTRFYRAGERIGVIVTTSAKTQAVPDVLPLNFTLSEPKGGETIFVIWLESYTDPYHALPLLRTSDLELLKAEGLIVENSSDPKFLGETTEDGDYTLVFTTGYYNKDNTPLDYLALSKIIVEEDRPYAFAMPLGVAFLIVGILATPLVIRSHRKKPRRHSKADKGKR